MNKKIPKVLFIYFFLFQLLFPINFSAASTEEVDRISNLLLKLQGNITSLKTLGTEFVQEKNLAAFQKKIYLKGRIYLNLQKPVKIAWHVDAPVKYSIIITEKGLTQWDEYTKQVQEIPSSRTPMLGALMDQISGWFNGQFTLLQKDYNVSIVQEKPLTLDFTPKDGKVVKKILKFVSIGFQENEKYLAWIKIQEVSGDNTTITFNNTAFNISDADRFFEAGGK